MDYSNYIGERVKNCYSGKEGILSEVGGTEICKILFDDSQISVGMLYDPFIAEDMIFINKDIQKIIDAEIQEIYKNYIEMIKKYSVNDETAKYYISLDNPDRTFEIIYKLNCEKNIAYCIFNYVIREQQKDLRNKKISKWRVVRLFDAKTNIQLAQES